MRTARHLHLAPHALLVLLAIFAYEGVTSGRVGADEPKKDQIAGTWAWTWKDGEGKVHKHVLDIEAVEGKLTGRERYDDLDSIKVDDLSLKGSEVSFRVKRGERLAEYKGKLVGEKTINGLVSVVLDGQASEYQWTAERALDTKKK